VVPLIPASTLGALLTPALAFGAPSSEVSLARIWELGARRAGKFTVVVNVPPQSIATTQSDAGRHAELLAKEPPVPSKPNEDFAQGDPVDSVFYIREGRVKISVVSAQGKEASRPEISSARVVVLPDDHGAFRPPGPWRIL
jgi:hypothetical protein